MLEESELWECQKHQMIKRELGEGEAERKIKKASEISAMMITLDVDSGRLFEALRNAVAKWKFRHPIPRQKIISQSAEKLARGKTSTRRLQIPWHSRILILNFFFVSWCSKQKKFRSRTFQLHRFFGWEKSLFSEINKSNKFSIQESYANKKIPLRDVLILFEKI